jgi:hypothetical protein
MARTAARRKRSKAGVEQPPVAPMIARYSPEVAAQLRRARAELRRHVPRGYEMIYDNYNALVFGFGPTARPSEIVFSVAGYPGWVTLFFARGPSLHDPQQLLEGSGTAIRSIRLKPFSRLRSQGVQALIRQALQKVAPAFADAPRRVTIVKSVSAKQRPRRPPARTKS